MAKSFPIVEGSGARYLTMPQIMPTGGTGQVRDVSAAGWFPVLQPVKPVAPAGTRPWQYNRPVGANVIWTPGDESNQGSVAFEILRAVADSWDLLRIVLETVKDRICAARWEVRLVRQPGQKIKDVEKAAATDKDVRAVREFLRCPDGDHTFEQWLRMLIEDMLVLDAMAVYKERDVKGHIASLRPIDGATIFRVLTDQGFTPRAKGDVAYQQVLYGMPSINLSVDDLTYVMRNPRTHRRYGLSAVEQILITINLGLSKQRFDLNWYTEGNMPEAAVFLPPTVPPNQVLEVQQWFDSMLAGDLAKRRRITFLPGFGDKDSKPNLTFFKEALLKNELDEWLFKIICYTLGVTPQNVVKAMNRASAEAGANSAEEEGLDPKLQTISAMINQIIQVDMGYDRVEFSHEQRREVDALKQAEIDHIYLNDGVITRNECREDIGKDEMAMPEMDEPGMITQNGFVALSGGQADIPGSGSGKGPAGKLIEQGKQTQAQAVADQQDKDQNQGQPEAEAPPQIKDKKPKKANEMMWGHCARHEFYNSSCVPCAKSELYRVQHLASVYAKNGKTNGVYV